MEFHQPPTNTTPQTGQEKMFISLQAGQNFPPAGQISLQWGMGFLVYFFIFSLQITKFPGKSFPFCLFFPGLTPNFDAYLWNDALY